MLLPLVVVTSEQGEKLLPVVHRGAVWQPAGTLAEAEVVDHVEHIGLALPVGAHNGIEPWMPQAIALPIASEIHRLKLC